MFDQSNSLSVNHSLSDLCLLLQSIVLVILMNHIYHLDSPIDSFAKTFSEFFQHSEDD